MPTITGLTASTELEAVNAMLSAIGEAPVADLSSTATDVTMALNILRNATREVQTMGWRFNTEFGYEVPAVDTAFNWTDTTGATTALRVFTPPEGLATFRVSEVQGQQGSRRLDTVVRPSRRWGPEIPGTPIAIDDELTDVELTPLTQHRSADGFGWGFVSGAAEAVFDSLGLLTVSGFGSDPVYRFGFPVPVADYSVAVSGQSTSALDLDSFSVGGRGSATTKERYKVTCVQTFGGGCTIFLYYVDAVGVETVLGQYADARGDLHKYRVTLDMAGSAIRVLLDGVQRIAVTNTQLPGTTPTYAFIGGSAGSAGPTQMHIEDFSVFYGIGREPAGTLVFYDRAKNRDGFDPSERTSLYIDPVWLFDFVALPETARRYIVVRSARELAQQAVGSGEIASFTANDELVAYRNLKRDQGQEEDVNMFDNYETSAFLGGRTPIPQGPIDNRNSAGPITRFYT